MEKLSLLTTQETENITIWGQKYPVIVCAPGATSPKGPSPKMAKRDTVGVYMPNSSKPENWRLLLSVARQMRNQGLLDFINHKCDVRLKFVAMFQPSGATIKMSEMLTNAGANGASRTAHMTEAQRLKNTNRAGRREPEDFIERAQFKIAIWPGVGDTRAIRVGPRVDRNAVLAATSIARYARRNQDCHHCGGDGCAACTEDSPRIGASAGCVSAERV